MELNNSMAGHPFDQRNAAVGDTRQAIGSVGLWLLNVFFVIFVTGCPLLDPPGLPVVGTIQDSQTGEGVTGADVSVALLTRHGSVLSTGSTVANGGVFEVRTNPLSESPATGVIEVTIARDGCESLFSLEAGTGFAVENAGLFDGELTLRVTAPILVPPCDAEGDGAP